MDNDFGAPEGYTLRLRFRGGWVKGRGFVKKRGFAYIIMKYLFISALAVSRPKIYTFKKPVGHTHLWTCACGLVHFRAIDSAIAAILLRMRIQRKPSGLVYSSAR